jgi:hypothetical protein
MSSVRVAAVLAAVVTMAFALGGCSTPPNRAWCAYVYDHGTIDCAYDTYEQCQATVFGAGGYCSQNPRGARGPSPRRTR